MAFFKVHVIILCITYIASSGNQAHLFKLHTQISSFQSFSNGNQGVGGLFFWHILPFGKGEKSCEIGPQGGEKWFTSG